MSSSAKTPDSPSRPGLHVFLGSGVSNPYLRINPEIATTDGKVITAPPALKASA